MKTSVHQLHLHQNRIRWIVVISLLSCPWSCYGQAQDTIEGTAMSRITPSGDQTQPLSPATCSKCQDGSTCVHGLTDYPAMQKSYGNPYRIWDCRDTGDCDSTVVQRWKRSMQASHWGYPEYFHRNNFGYANRNAFSNNIRDGAIERATIYLMDFYPEDSTYAHMLTPKGLERLEKAICVNKSLGSPLRFEKSTRPELNELRRQWLSEHPLILAAGLDSGNIQWISNPSTIMATEAIRSYQRGISGSSGQASSSGLGFPTSGSFPMAPGNTPSATTGNPGQ